MLKKLSFAIAFVLILFSVIYFLIHFEKESQNLQTAIQNKRVIHWKMANTWGKGTPVLEQATLDFAKNVQAMSGGRLVIDVHAAQIHKAPLGVFDLVRTGQYQLGHSASYYWKGKDPATPTLTTTPFGMNFFEQYAWFYHGQGLEQQQSIYGKHGLLSFPGGNTGVQMGGWFKKEIHSLEDMKGLKMRIPGMGGDVLKKIGAEPVNIAPGELYTSLQLGTIDALEWIGPKLDFTLGFQQVADYYYTGWHEPASELQFLANKEAFESLPEDLRMILLTAMKASAFDLTIHHFHENAFAWQEMKTKFPNVKIKSFPKDVKDELKKQTDVVLDEMKAVSAETKSLIESQGQYYKTVKEWTEISEQAYLNQR